MMLDCIYRTQSVHTHYPNFKKKYCLLDCNLIIGSESGEQREAIKPGCMIGRQGCLREVSKGRLYI